VEVLRNLQGWDYANVTEDADLGIRLARLGFEIVPLNTITWEEAPPNVYPWLRQRTRWNKGFIYTLIIHFKKPRHLVRDLGLGPTIFLFYLLSSPVIFFIAMPGWFLFSIYWLSWFGVPLEPLASWIQEAFKSNSIIFYLSIATFLFGLLYSPLMALEGLFRQGDEYSLRKVKYTFLAALYMDLQSIPSTVAIFELLFRPKLWHKTPHGFFVQSKISKQHK
jgi:cellulose synthase/poly-beta-1,6-N-acetylglucosamine synthase-like glycosyltransferase